jgi:hypothetical protein
MVGQRYQRHKKRAEAVTSASTPFTPESWEGLALLSRPVRVGTHTTTDRAGGGRGTILAWLEIDE